MISLPWTRSPISSGHHSAASLSAKVRSLRPQALHHENAFMDDAKLDDLASIPLFAGRSKEDLVYLASRVDIVRAEAGCRATVKMIT